MTRFFLPIDRISSHPLTQGWEWSDCFPAVPSNAQPTPGVLAAPDFWGVGR
jgi:hypothetical protein